MLRFTRYPELGPKTAGSCDPPDDPRRSIRVDENLPPDEMHEVLIHECTHGAFWWLDEEFVRKFAADLSAILLDPQIRDRWDRRV